MSTIRSKITAIGGTLAYPPIRLRTEVTRKHFYGKGVVVTGASHGIGRALTEKLIAAGANIFLVARSKEDLQLLCTKAKQQGCQAEYHATDLRNREDMELLCQRLKKALPQLDYFFCNAGKSIHRNITDAVNRLHDYDRTMDLNYRALVALSLTLLPALKAGKGSIIYSSSVSTLYPMAPGWSAYHVRTVRHPCTCSLSALGSYCNVGCERAILQSAWIQSCRCSQHSLETLHAKGLLL